MMGNWRKTVTLLLLTALALTVQSQPSGLQLFSSRGIAGVDQPKTSVKGMRQALCQAIRASDVESCRKLVKEGVDITVVPVVKDPDRGPLGLAVSQRQTECLKAMLEASKKAGRPVASDDLDTLLNLRNWPECMEVLLESRSIPEPNAWENYPAILKKRLNTLWTSETLAVLEKHAYKIPLVAWIKNGDIAKIKAALEKGGAENDLKAGNGKALAVAVTDGTPEIVKILLAAGADPNSLPELEGGSALMLAVADNSSELVEMLLNAKADPNLVDPERKWTPLHEAVKRGNLDLVKRLIKAKAKVNVTDENSETPLFLAIRGRLMKPGVSLAITKVLLENGADAKEKRTIQGHAYPIILFSQSDQMRALLYKHGAKIPERPKR